MTEVYLETKRMTFDSEIGQLGNFASGRREIKSLDDYDPGVVQEAAITGMLTIIPDIVHQSEILSSPERMAMVDKFVAFQSRFNDRVDFEGAGRDGVSSLVDESRELEKKAWLEFEQSVEHLQDKEIILSLVKDYIDETEAVERHIRLNRHRLSYDDVEKYRSYVNAIATVVLSSVILGDSFLDQSRTGHIDGQLSYEAVKSKYGWVVNGSPSKDSKQEKAVVIIYNMAMASQVDDDWWGRSIDQLLNIPSFASGALQEFGNDEERARQFLRGVKDSYVKQAQKHGLGIIPSKGMAALSGIMQRFAHVVAKKARRFTDRLPFREKAFVTGKL
ncbi:hypothetical protein H6762_03845 [Candidatus Nomurabacteria bacterium]|nr:hypothetical protein [Candidatus Nomurabacteria bacterium]